MTARLTAGFGVLLTASFLSAAPAAAQSGGSGFGIGPRITFVRGSANLPDGAQRFSGAAVRLGGGRTALEIAMDFRSGVSGDLTERIKDYPISGSLLIFPVRARIAPYLVGGVGWYSQHVQHLGPTEFVVDEQTTRKLGYHAGFGGEVRAAKHLGLYGDYRYTFIHFGEQPSTTASSGGATPALSSWIPFADRLRMSHEGSAFTWGATLYF